MSTIREIPRRTVRTSLAVTRLPLTAAEAALGHRGDEAWAPAMAFDRFGAGVKEMVGSVLRDRDFADEGRLTADKLDQMQQAIALEAAAETKRESAEDELEQRRAEADERKQRARQLEQERKQAIARDEAVAERKAAQAASRQRAEAEKTEAASAKAVDRRARTGRRVAVAKEERAVEEERRAVTARRRAAALDKGVQAQKDLAGRGLSR